MKKYTLSILILILPAAFCAAQSQPSQSTQQQAATSPEVTRDWSFKVGAGFINQLLYRGAVYWPEPTAFPFLGLEYKNMISLDGPGFSFFDKTPARTYLVGYRYFDDARPWIRFSGKEIDFRNYRDPSQSIFASVQYSVFKYGFIRLLFDKEISNFQGNYIAASCMLPILPFTGINFKIGYGDTNANRYAYGVGAKEGWADIEPGFALQLPFLPGGGMLIVSYSQPWIIQGENRRATYVSESDRPELWLAMATYKL